MMWLGGRPADKSCDGSSRDTCGICGTSESVVFDRVSLLEDMPVGGLPHPRGALPFKLRGKACAIGVTERIRVVPTYLCDWMIPRRGRPLQPCRAAPGRPFDSNPATLLLIQN